MQAHVREDGSIQWAEGPSARQLPFPRYAAPACDLLAELADNWVVDLTVIRNGRATVYTREEILAQRVDGVWYVVVERTRDGKRAMMRFILKNHRCYKYKGHLCLAIGGK